MTAADHPRMHQ